MSNGTFDVKDAGYSVGVNVRLRKIDKKTGQILETREGHNRCLKMTLMGIAKFMNGEFNPTQNYLIHYDWIPRYLGVGTNIASGTPPVGITSEVTVNDTRLLNEISPRIRLAERNKIINRSTQNYIQLVIVTYLPEEYYNNQTIAEAGLFSKEEGNNCLFRIAFDGIQKTIDSVVEVNWTISIISVDSGNSPLVTVDKSDLETAIEHLLDRFIELNPDPDFVQACTDLKENGISEYVRSDSTQETVDATTLLLNTDLANL